jgi:hypothetical protein
VQHSDCDSLPGDGICGGLRHFLCYGVANGEGFGPVSLDDQFGAQDVDTLLPEYFCNPVEKTIPDCCNSDLNGDGIVSAADFAILSACFGADCADINCDGVTNAVDLNIFNCQFGTSPPDPACCPGAIPPGVYPIVDPLEHLTCYHIDPKIDLDLLVSTNDQLDQSDLLIRTNELLCLPTIKVPEPAFVLGFGSGALLLAALGRRRRRRQADRGD